VQNSYRCQEISYFLCLFVVSITRENNNQDDYAIIVISLVEKVRKMTVTQAKNMNLAHLYEQDFFLWLQTTANLLKEKQFQEIDLENLIEEIESMGRGEKRAVKSNLKILLMHLLKYQYQSQLRSNSWRYTIIEHRNRLKDDLKDSPSLKPYLLEVFEDTYQDARKEASAETGLSLDTFPLESPFSIEETLNPDFLPHRDDRMENLD
jgi:Domain of unknown function DUF29